MILLALSLMLCLTLVVVFIKTNDTKSTLSTAWTTDTATAAEAGLTDSLESEDDSTYQFSVNSLTSIIQSYLEEEAVDLTQISYFFNSELLTTPIIFNGDVIMTAASTTKLPLVMYYYDQIASGTLTSQSRLTYCVDCDDENSPIDALYGVGDQVPLATLLHYTILYSDNAASNILRSALGDYSAWRQAILKYTPLISATSQWNSENVTSADYGQAVIEYLYANQSNYPQLIADMKQAATGKYLQDIDESVDIAHKYGWYDGYIHDYGIVYTEIAYQIGVFTDNLADGEAIISHINEICFAYNQWLVSQAIAGTS